MLRESSSATSFRCKLCSMSELILQWIALLAKLSRILLASVFSKNLEMQVVICDFLLTLQLVTECLLSSAEERGIERWDYHRNANGGASDNALFVAIATLVGGYLGKVEVAREKVLGIVDGDFFLLLGLL